MTNLLPLLCFFFFICQHLVMLLLQPEFFPRRLLSLRLPPSHGSPLLALPPLNSAVSRCKAKGYKPLSISSKRVAVFWKLHKRDMLHFMKFVVKYDIVFLQNVWFVIVALFCAWDSDRWSVLAACLFVCV